jgi:hypothetical protein
MAITKKRFWATARRGLPTIFQDRVNVAAEGPASYRRYQRETSLEMRQVFMAGPDDEQVAGGHLLTAGRYA